MEYLKRVVHPHQPLLETRIGSDTSSTATVIGPFRILPCSEPHCGGTRLKVLGSSLALTSLFFPKQTITLCCAVWGWRGMIWAVLWRQCYNARSYQS